MSEQATDSPDRLDSAFKLPPSTGGNGDYFNYR
jgi:hypothetical protein